MDYSDYVRERIKKCSKIKFTKKRYKAVLERRGLSDSEVKKDLLNPLYLVFSDREVRSFKSRKEIRYRCYFIFSNSRGRCYILKFNLDLKVVTVFPLGRKTLNKYRKRFK